MADAPGKKPLSPYGAAASIALVAGSVASLILWDWRWVVIGLGVLFILAAIDAARGRHRD